MTGEVVTAALAYAAHGWPVFPVALVVDGTCRCDWPADRCTSPGKHPMNPGGCRQASTERDVIRRWWARWPDANIGVATGKVANLAVLDIDGEDGRASLARIEAEHGPLPGTVTSITSRGCHLLYRWPDGLGIGSGRYGPGLDHRGEGGYIIAPPSRHPSGHTYRWLDAGGDEAAPWAYPLPAWPQVALPVQRPAERVVVPFPPRPGVLTPNDLLMGRASAGGPLAGLVRRLVEAPAGTRNHTLNWAAFRAGEHIAAGRLDEVQAVTALQLAAERIGLTEAETRATIASGLSKGLVA